MKRLGMALAVAILAGLSAQQTLACPWGGYYGPSEVRGGWDYGPAYQRTAPPAAYQRFLDETSDLRKTLAAKKGEYEALMAGPDPDPKRSAQLSQEIVEIQERLREKAREYGVARMGHHGRGGRGMAPWGGWYCRGYCW